MLSSPILHVELLTVGRRRRYFVLRVVYTLQLFFALTICYLENFRDYRPPTIQDQAEFAFAFFVAFSFIQLSSVLLLTPAMTAGTISSEHERRTIDYLLTTELYDSEIALGKFAARLWGVTTLLAVGLPILALAMSLGGIGVERLLASFGTALVALASVGSLSICISARAAKSRDAITRSYLIILAAMAVPPTLLGLAVYAGSSNGQMPTGFWKWLMDAAGYGIMLNPLVYLATAIVERTSPMQMSFTTFAAVHLGLAGLMCVSAVVGVRRFSRKEAGRSKGSLAPPRKAPAAPQSPPAATPAASPVDADPTAERTGDHSSVRYARLLRKNRAMWWKELVSQKTFLRMGWGGRIATVLLAGAAIFWLGAAFLESYRHRPFGSRDDFSALLAYSMGGVPAIAYCCLLLIASRAAGGIAAEKEQDTWVTLVSTPLDGRDVVPAKIIGAIYSVRYWYLLIGVAWMLTAIRHPEQIVLLPFLVVGHLTAALFCAALGVYLSLRMRTSLKAIGTTLAVLVFGVSMLPGIFAGLVQEEEPLGFSLPAALGMLHPMLHALIREETYRSSRETGFAVVVVVAMIGYAVAAAVIASLCVGTFDELVGRTTARTPTHSGSGPGGKALVGANDAAPSIESGAAD